MLHNCAHGCIAHVYEVCLSNVALLTCLTIACMLHGIDLPDAQTAACDNIVSNNTGQTQ